MFSQAPQQQTPIHLVNHLFKFAQQIDETDPDCEQKQQEVLSTAAIGVFASSLLFGGLIFLFLEPLAGILRYQETSEIILLVLGILMLEGVDFSL